MSINIKNERVCSLAREAAARTGLTQTSAIEEGLKLLLERAGVDPRQAAIGEKKRRVRELLEEVERRREAGLLNEVFTDHDLYDPETGLPA